jgi:hypothetical protein
MVEIKQSKVPGSGDGLFAKIQVNPFIQFRTSSQTCRVLQIEPNTVLAFYNGKRIRPRSWEDQDFTDWTKNAYRIFDPANKTGTLDIPEKCRSIENYCASLAHKTNHSFLPNAEFVAFNHPRYVNPVSKQKDTIKNITFPLRFGIVPCLISTHDIECGEEVFVHYGYDLENCPQWYEDVWLKGSYPIPESMRKCYNLEEENENESSNPTKQMVEDIVDDVVGQVVENGNGCHSTNMSSLTSVKDAAEDILMSLIDALDIGKSTYTCKPAPFDRQTNAKENPKMQSYYHQAAVAAIAAEEPI